jgi:hypothetical protein
MADVEQMLAAREAAADAIVQAVGRLGVALREEQELTEALRRELRAAGISAQPFLTQPDFREAICAELGRAGLHLHRADPRISLPALVAGQHRGVRGLLAYPPRRSGPAAA